MAISINTKIFSHSLLSRFMKNKGIPGSLFFCGHAGPSMNPTLNAQDLLEIRPYYKNKPGTGDVVLYRQPHTDCFIVHRIIHIGSKGIKTRGDNNSNVDSGFLQPGDIYGQVVAAQSGETRRKIANGLKGMTDSTVQLY